MIDSFGDFNGDGAVDLISGWITQQPLAGGVRILSGVDGSIILSRASAYGRNAGDVDGDGQLDYAYVSSSPFLGMQRLNVVSFATGQPLWFADGPWPAFAAESTNTSLMAGRLDLNGDGRSDMVAVSHTTTQSDVYAFDSSGALLYLIPARSYGFVAQNATAMPDLDGDSGDDFLVGVAESSGRGGVAVVSGRTGQIIRISYGLLPGDYLGGTVCNAGDVDQDGMADYAAASYWSSPLTSIAIFSGRTGAVIRSWTDYWTIFDGMLGDIDVDLDGVPDLLVGNGGWQLGPNTWGQLRAYSGRDGSVLWNMDATLFDQLAPQQLTNLGPQPGSPYPVVAFRDDWYSGPQNARNRVIALRTNLLGAGPVTGAPCSSAGPPPQIGMRRIPGGTRITVAKGPPGALALLAGGPAAQTVFGGTSVPFALDPFGLPGCNSYVAPVVVVSGTLGTAGIDRGYASVDLPWPTLSTTGVALAAQWVMLDAATGAYAVTARHEFRVP